MQDGIGCFRLGFEGQLCLSVALLSRESEISKPQIPSCEM